MFPKVTVCNINMFKFDDVTPLLGGYALFYDTGLQYLRSIMPEVGITSTINDSYSSELDGETYPDNSNLQEFIRYNSHKMKDMLEMCIFNGVECGADNFTMEFTNYGACYVFQPTSMTSIKNAGQRYGLSMILNVEHVQYITAPRENVGFRIAIDCYHDSPNIEASGVDVGTGMRASIGLRKQSLTMLPAPHGQCVAEGTKQLQYYKNASYTQSRCYLECQTNYFMNACGCRTFYTPGNSDQPFCSPANLTKCYIPKYNEFITHREEYCTPTCEEACMAESYLRSNSYSGFPSIGVPQTFHVTNNYKYYALALGFSVK
ncbi:acid-sensing ion channel 1-like [Antedon mediterranea]|uniref:acid-sensing ion channel 1-like n=1 Tax=Antedon mediterranea TaxID=105859 RepID=UPI003AF4DF74